MTKSKKRTQILSNTRALAYAKNVIIKANSIYRALSSIRVNTPPNLYSEIIDMTLAVNRHNGRIQNAAFPKTLADLRTEAPMPQSSIEMELKWACGYFSVFAKFISAYNIVAKQFQEKLLKGEYKDAESILDRMEEQFGFSLYSIKSRIGLLQISRGLESQKKYVSNLREQTVGNGIVFFISYYISQRVEPSLSIHSFEEEFKDLIDILKVPAWVKQYILYHVTPARSINIEDISRILGYESTSSLVDYYEAFIEMTQILVANGQNAYFGTLHKLLRKLAEVLSDFRISSLLCILDNENTEVFPGEFDISAISAFDYYLAADYERAIYTSKRKIARVPLDMDTLEIMARSISISGITDNEIGIDLLINEILRDICLVYSRNEASLKAAMNLYKKAWIFSHNSWSKYLLAFLNREMSPINYKVERVASVHWILNAPNLSPSNIIYIDDPSYVNKFLEKLSASAEQNSLLLTYCSDCIVQGVVHPDARMSMEETSVIAARKHLGRDSYGETLETIEPLSHSKALYFKSKYIQIRSYCLLKLGRIAECVNLIVETHLDNPFLLPILPMEELIDALDKAERRKLNNNINIPIVLDIYCRNISKQYERIKKYAYEDFLHANGISRPSELRSLLGSFYRPTLIYYLRYVCIESVMDNATIFQGSQDLAKERIDICNLLCEIDSSNIDLYQTEIKDIHRKLMIKKKMRDIEKSKIYVDIDGLKDLATTNLKEYFSRYMLYVKEGIAISEKDIKEVESKIASGEDFQQVLTSSIPKNEAIDLLQTIILTLRDYYVSNPQFGLDVYLSVRIRHGTFAAQLRSPLESANLITTRDSTTAGYKTNTYWINRIGLNNNAIRDSVSSAFNEFSANFNSIIQVMLADWIQVSTSSGKKGLFNFSLYDRDLVYLASLIDEETKFDDFITAVFKYFTIILGKCLENVRYNIRNEAKVNCNTLLVDLQTRVNEIAGYHYDVGDILSAINTARTELQIVFDRVIDWFRLFNDVREEPYSIEDAINISVNSMKTVSPEFDAEISVPEDMINVMFQGSLPSFVDMLFIIFANIVSHSHIDHPRAHVGVAMVNEAIVLRISNEVAEGIASEAAKLKIESIKKAIAGDISSRAMITEGGTGFHKINRILGQRFRSSRMLAEQQLDFGFDGDSHFFVKVEIPTIIVTIKAEE